MIGQRVALWKPPTQPHRKALGAQSLRRSKLQRHFCGNEKPILKVVRNFKIPQMVKTIFKNKVVDLSLPDFKIYYKATGNPNNVVLASGQTYRPESTEINSMAN